MLMSKSFILIILLFLIIKPHEARIDNENYSPEKKDSDSNEEPDLKTLYKPFRMAKLNFAWTKGQRRLNGSRLKSFYAELKIRDKELFEWKHKTAKDESLKKGLEEAQLMYKLVEVMESYGLLNYIDKKKVSVAPSALARLTESKLKSLYTELKMQDKEEIGWKQLNSQHKDKEGLKADKLRQKLVGIMSTYDLLDHFEETQDPVKTKPYKKFHESDDYINKSMFKDKKLNRLWEKAEHSGFTTEELASLQEEFSHHQDKVDVYYSLLESIGSLPINEYHENVIYQDELENFNTIPEPNDNDNEIQPPYLEENIYHKNIDELRDRHRAIKDHYDRLERMVSNGPHSEDFIEPKVQGLWRVALASSFSQSELTAIKAELYHFQTRLLKLRHLHAEHALQKQKYKNQKQHQDKIDRFEEMEDHIKKQTRKVEKIQENIEGQIFKHTEL